MIEKDALRGIEINLGGGGGTLNGGQQPRTIYLTSWQVHSRRNPFNQVLRQENRVSRCRLNRYVPAKPSSFHSLQKETSPVLPTDSLYFSFG